MQLCFSLFCVFFKIFITKATVSAPCEPCMSCRLVSYCFSHVYMYYHSTNKMDGWMDGVRVYTAV